MMQETMDKNVENKPAREQDPFYLEENMARLQASIAEMEKGLGQVHKELPEVEDRKPVPLAHKAR